MNTFLLVITTGYTVAAMIAVCLHSLNLREVLKNYHAIRLVDDKLGREWAKMSVRIEAARLAKAVLIAGLGVGVLAGFREIGWILIPIPLIGIFSSWLDLRSRERQAVLAEQILESVTPKPGETPLIAALESGHESTSNSGGQ